MLFQFAWKPACCVGFHSQDKEGRGKDKENNFTFGGLSMT